MLAFTVLWMLDPTIFLSWPVHSLVCDYVIFLITKSFAVYRLCVKQLLCSLFLQDELYETLLRTPMRFVESESNARQHSTAVDTERTDENAQTQCHTVYYAVFVTVLFSIRSF